MSSSSCSYSSFLFVFSYTLRKKVEVEMKVNNMVTDFAQKTCEEFNTYLLNTYCARDCGYKDA